jgi:phosphosulfolactate synthase (CoM biosynthesis protein A)
LDDWGEYIDGFKFAGGSQRLLDKEKVKKIIELCHDYMFMFLQVVLLKE